MKYYVGSRTMDNGTVWEVFRCDNLPTKTTHPFYDYVIGPFRTQRAAKAMVTYGFMNPHLQTVSQAESYAKRHKEDSSEWKMAKYVWG